MRVEKPWKAWGYIKTNILRIWEIFRTWRENGEMGGDCKIRILCVFPFGARDRHIRRLYVEHGQFAGIS